ncbi:polysaccharide pyruvyl transferase family protein [Acinetobacter baumannii]|uniref:polysaccharide pyruvyl transferase family protein n=1 Tax=Acinetobacter baumannii TaxID=470 RepID=UPI00280CCAD0|nr:polysaccharide pyruvyl transferase family protein [Acinetobacter baumannii]MDQ8960288.1 polysaccharide pyruvyl transferase family protein [Acinetobacter baumannii]
MKKIAILTQPLGHNYGGMLQAWALQQVVTQLGYNVVTIDRQPAKLSLTYLFIRLAYRALLKGLGKGKSPIFIESKKKVAYKNTRDFISTNLIMSEPLFSTLQLIEHFDDIGYDAVIVGSDQTWRPKYSPCIENFYLDFLEKKKIKKIAYASSFGVSEWEYDAELTARCSKLANLFDWISVREDSGVELCKKYFNIDADHVLDPTLLLSQSDYRKLIGQGRLDSKSSGIYTYILDSSSEKTQLIESFAKEHAEQVYSCQAKCSIEESIDPHDMLMPDPRDWLAGFANAKYVITDSFHGTVFSIIFNKPFISISNSGRGATRFQSLLKIFNLEDRLVSNHNEITHKLSMKPINYDIINNILDIERKKSVSLLMKAIDNGV